MSPSPLRLHTAGPAAGPVDEPADDVEPDPTPLPVLTARGGQMSWFGQSTAAALFAVRASRHRIREMRASEGGLIHALEIAKPPSYAEEDTYARDRKWVPHGHEGGIAEGMGVVFHRLAGRPGVAIGNTISSISHRPMRAVLAYASALLVIFLTLIKLHHVFAAAVLISTSAFIGALWFLAGLIWAAIRNRGNARTPRKAAPPS